MRFALRSRGVLIGLAGATAALTILIWVEREALFAWYTLRQLAGAGPASRETWVERAASLEGAALPGLLGILEREDSRACGNAQMALARITERWAANDPRWPTLLDQLAEDFSHQRVPGRECTLQQVAEWLRTGPGSAPRAATSCASRLLNEVRQSEDREVEAPALDLAAALLASPEQGEHLVVCHALARRGLASAEADTRVRALRLALYPGLHLTPVVIPLLSDPQPEVRRAAMLAVGTSPEAITTDSLIHWLHDPDGDVRRLCEAALLAREDFQPEHLPLARLITDAQPLVRLQVLNHLQRDSSLEPGIWLRRLGHDPAPEVRAAALRAAASQSATDLTDLLNEKAQNDPSATVTQLAQYYLSTQKRR